MSGSGLGATGGLGVANGLGQMRPGMGGPAAVSGGAAGSAMGQPPGAPAGGAPGMSALAGLGGGAVEDVAVPADATSIEAARLEGAEGAPDVVARLQAWVEMPNICEDMEIPEDELLNIAQRVARDYDIDENSRADWKTKYEAWMDFAMQVAEEKTYPWPQASNVIYPLITSAAIQFGARAYPAIVRDRNVVKGSVIGPDQGTPVKDPATGQVQVDAQGEPLWLIPPGAKRERADKIGRHMSWQLLDEQPEWEPETDKLLIVLPIVGLMYRKSFFDPELQRNVSTTVNAMDLCVNYKAKSFEVAPRKTELIRLYKWQIETKIRSGVYLDEDYGFDQGGEDGSDGADEDPITTFLEQHRRWDLDGDGYAEPYIVTVARDSQKIARIRAAYEMDGVEYEPETGRVRKITEIEYYTPYQFIPSPESGVYALGFGHLLFPLNSAINSSLNQMFDAGHLQNAGGGFIGSQLSTATGSVRFQVGEYKQVNTNGATIRDNVFPLPFAGPSQVLFALMQYLVEAGKEVAAVKDIMVGDMPGDNTSGITTLAVIEQGLTVFSAIYKRIYRSLKSEYKKLFRLNRLYLPLSSGFQNGEQWAEISRRDYAAGAGVEPVSDPRMMTDMQRLGRAQFMGQFKDDPWFEGRKVRLSMLEAAQIPDADQMLVKELPPNGAMVAQMAQLDLADRELKIRGAHWEAEMDIKRAESKAREIDLLAHAILNLANAAKADSAAAAGWYDGQMAALKNNVEALNVTSSVNPTENSPADAAGIGAVAPQPGGTPGGGQPAGFGGGVGGPGAIPGGGGGGAGPGAAAAGAAGGGGGIPHGMAGLAPSSGQPAVPALPR